MLRLITTLSCTLAMLAPAAEAQFRISPYLQNPAADEMTVVWFSEDEAPGELTLFDVGSTVTRQSLRSSPQRADDLAYPAWEADRFFAGAAPAPPFVHRIRLLGLTPRTTYRYVVRQNALTEEGFFTTAPAPGTGAVRLIFFADSETEPESTGNHVDWPDPQNPEATRRYPLDQTTGFARNLGVIREREPDLIAIAGDLVESGGEQRDWDEFWGHVTDVEGVNLAGRIPILAAPGNHEYYEGPAMGRYDQPGSERAADRFRTYFEVPDADGPSPRGNERYYRLDYGPLTLIALDATNGSPHGSADDTNFFLLGTSEPGGGGSPGFGPGSRQHAWLEAQLADARRRSAFTFVFFHHIPYSVGPHGWPAGEGDGFDTQSGVPVRSLTPLFMRYGVHAVIAGHDEMWERSSLQGTQILDDGSGLAHTLHVIDVGIGGDGLRGPQEGLGNPHQQFLVHDDAEEIWQGETLVAGGKHYGHLEIDVLPAAGGGWQAVLKPVHVFPLMQGADLQAVERRLYDDVVTLSRQVPTVVGAAGVEEVGQLPTQPSLERPFPNPFNSSVLLRFVLDRQTDVQLDVYDVAGQRVRRLLHESRPAGAHAVEWDGSAANGSAVASGVYLFRLQTGTFSDTVEASLIR